MGALVFREDLTNLVRNGSGELGNVENFPGATFDVDAPAGAFGSFVYETGAVRSTTDIVPINFVDAYLFALWVRQRTPGDPAQVLVGLHPHDAFGLGITPINYMAQPGTTTTLADALVSGATTMRLTSAANWHNSAGAGTHLRNVIFWGYTDAGGTVWPVHTYSRRTIANAYLDGGVNYSTGVVTLRVPYVGATIPAGTPVSNGSNGSNFMYLGGAAFTPPGTWTQYTAPFQGLHTTPALAASTAFPYGTAGVRVVFLPNRVNSATSRHAFAGVTFRPTTPRLVSPAIRRWNGAAWVAATATATL